VNSGSSSLKLALYEDDTLIASSAVEGLGLDEGRITVRDETGRVVRDERGAFRDARAALRATLAGAALFSPDAVGHRIVHGGADHAAPERVTPQLLAALRTLVPLAPLHLPAALAAIDAVGAQFPGLPQIACFDTAFHRRMPAVAQRLPLPRALRAKGIQRYGFHGLSYEYVVAAIGAATLGRAVIAHLGNGASLAAVRDGLSVDTTMGFTPTGGLMMGTRSGDLDPGVLVHLLAHEGFDAGAIERLVDHESGLLGVSGTTSDMKTLLETRATEPHAAEAIELFCHVLRKHIGALAVVPGGLDALVFTGGIGERAAAVRERRRGLEHLGIQIDRARNARHDPSSARREAAARCGSCEPTKPDDRPPYARAARTGVGVKKVGNGACRTKPGGVMKPETGPLSTEELRKMDAYWRAANYLSVGQIYLYDNPLLKEPLERAHIKPRLLGHWGTTPGLNLLYVHLNRVIKQHDLNMIYVIGPGHGGPALVANAYLEGTYSDVYPGIAQDADGMQKLFKQFSFPGGIPSHVAPETPGSIHEGGELGYALSHAHGAAFDNPDLIVACVVGDGEAETGPLATGWHSNKFLNPARDGAVLPILHLNGYKIANPCFLARIPRDELQSLLQGYGYAPHFVEGDEPEKVHQELATTLDAVVADIKQIQLDARTKGITKRPAWPMIVLRTPKGWTCPKEIDGKKCEG
jgi:acetate kinase